MMEHLKGHKFTVLDHGFVRVVDFMGDDAAIVQAARVSYGEGTKTVNEDQGLINYLMRHRHTSPFEMCELKLHVKMPLFVARQWVRHRMASINEVSARYSILPEEFYVPEQEHLAKQATNNKQGRGEVISSDVAPDIQELIWQFGKDAFKGYDYLLNDVQLARELARMVLPLNTYTEFYWKIDLHNLLHFLKLRADPHAQYEIRVYADTIIDLCKLWVPMTMEAWENYVLNARTFSAKEMELLSIYLNLELISGKKAEECGLSKGEFREFLDKIRRQSIEDQPS